MQTDLLNASVLMRRSAPWSGLRRGRDAIAAAIGRVAGGVAILAAALAQVAGGAEVSPRTIRVVMDNNYPPYVFQSAGGPLQGILVDRWRLWEKKTGEGRGLRGGFAQGAQGAIAAQNKAENEKLCPSRSKY